MDMEDQLQALCAQWHATDDAATRATIEAAYDDVLRAVDNADGIVDLEAELPLEHMPAWYLEKYPARLHAVWGPSTLSRQLTPEEIRNI